MHGFLIYERLMAKWATDYTRPTVDALKKGDVLVPPKHDVFEKILYGFTEISNTYDALKLSEKLVSLSPPKSKHINSDEYLKYLINTYLQDMYILKERLNSYATKIKRLHAKSDRGPLVLEHIDPLFDLVKSHFGSLVDTRGKHVHENRYSDEHLDSLTQISLIAKYYHEYESDRRSIYREVQKIWSSKMKINNQTTESLLNQYFDCLLLVVKVGDDVFMP